MPTKTAASRADELVAGGGGRGRSRRALMDEYGATANEADDLLDAAGGRAPDQPADEPSSSSGSSAGSSGSRVASKVGRGFTGGLDAGGGLILGVLLYVAGLTYLRGGSAGLKAWVRAKFLNKVDEQVPTGTSSSSSSWAPFAPAASSTGTPWQQYAALANGSAVVGQGAGNTPWQQYAALANGSGVVQQPFGTGGAGGSF
jgi:hypothetical protein